MLVCSMPAGGVAESTRLDGRNINRALLIRSSKKPENHLALLQLACGLIAFKRKPTQPNALVPYRDSP